MSVNEWGILKEPTSYVPPDQADSSRSARRAENSSPGAWDEDLGRYGDDRWNLPGYGERGPKCGEWYPEAVCEECGHLDLGTHNCGRRSCPKCWAIWAKEAGVRATVRIQSFRHTQPDNYHRQVAHAVVAPPEKAIMNKRQFYNGRSRAADIAEEKGFRGFAIIGHPWRIDEQTEAEYRDRDPDVGKWVWLRNEFSEQELRERVYWSPHYHIIGATTAEMDPGDESDQWVYEFVRSVESYHGIRDRDSHNDLYGSFRYLLSHTGFPEGSTKQAVTWYGDLANSVFVENASQEWQIEKPSEGVQNALHREVESVAGATEDGESEDEDSVTSESDDLEECPCGDCDGVLIDVFDIRAYLDHNDPPPEVANRMIVAYEWRIGDRLPPPGLKHPRTEAQAREAFEAMI